MLQLDVNDTQSVDRSGGKSSSYKIKANTRWQRNELAPRHADGSAGPGLAAGPAAQVLAAMSRGRGDSAQLLAGRRRVPVRQHRAHYQDGRAGPGPGWVRLAEHYGYRPGCAGRVQDAAGGE
ncbi:hypothetical protein MAJ_05108, partial [Metarhizium majus ARSEF 297]